MKNKIYRNFFTIRILIVLSLLFTAAFSEESAEELFNTALKYQKNGQLDQAEQYYKASLKLKSDVDAMYNLGILYEDKNNYTEAEKYFKMAYDAGLSKAAYKLGYVYSKLNKKDLSERYYLQSVTKDNNIDAMYNLAVLYNSSSKKNDAIKYC